MNLAHNLETSARFFPESPAVREGAREITYGELNESSNRVASALVKLGQEYSGLAYGDHTFEVRAIDGVGNVDPTPASYSWAIRMAVFLPMVMK